MALLWAIMRKFSCLKAILPIFIVLLCLTALTVNVQSASWKWNKVPIPNDASVVALDMINSTDGWAVGANGSIINWDGTSWTNIASPTLPISSPWIWLAKMKDMQ